MAIAAHPQASAGATNGDAPADVLVVFGITGDLAKVMTFNSLYRLEQRGLVDCPIVGVASTTGPSTTFARARARRSRPAAAPWTKRSSSGWPSGCPMSRATSATPPRSHASATRSTALSIPLFYLEIPPFLFGKVVAGLADAGLTENARVVVEKPFGHDVESARALNVEIHSHIARTSCTGSTISSGRWASPRSST